MTRHLERWKSDAEAMGIPENIQRGLAFMAGIDLLVNGGSLPQEELPIIAARMSKHLPNIPDDVGGNFNPDPIAGLLLELALQFDPGFTPRIITLPSGASFTSIRKEPGNRLPSLDPLNLANASRIAESLYSQIGDCFQEQDLESALVSGLRFFNEYKSLDPANTIAMCRDALLVRPPHMLWISKCFRYELPEDVSRDIAWRDRPVSPWDDSPLLRTLAMYFMGSRPFMHGLVRQFELDLPWAVGRAYERNLSELQDMEYTDNEPTFQQILREYIYYAPSYVNLPYFSDLVEQSFAEDPEEANGHICFRHGLEDAVEDLCRDVWQRWGYDDLTAHSPDLYLGEIYDRQCCILLSAVQNAVVAKCTGQMLAINEETEKFGENVIRHHEFITENQRRIEELEALMSEAE